MEECYEDFYHKPLNKILLNDPRYLDEMVQGQEAGDAVVTKSNLLYFKGLDSDGDTLS